MKKKFVPGPLKCQMVLVIFGSIHERVSEGKNKQTEVVCSLENLKREIVFLAVFVFLLMTKVIF